MKYVLSIVFALAVSVLGIFVLPQETDAADKSDFNPGHIIDDAVFYNSGSMSATQIQKFLESKNPNCDYNGTQSAADWGYPSLTHAQLAEKLRNGQITISGVDGSKFHAPPYKCLTRYNQSTPQMEAASGYCNAINSATRTAAQIIKDVASACGINPQVLIILLEKEQSLVTDKWPLNRQLQNATGFACPDTAPCDPAYGGFFYQVYHAARQFKVYQANPNSYNYRAGRNNNIYWHPDLTRCGSSTVYIQNQATAALYIYTPYRPNSAALNNLYGTGDSCSSYGNRNFWRIFTDWFGSTVYTTGGSIGNKYTATGGMTGPLGMPTSNEKVLASGGTYQQFENGRIYWKSKMGAWIVSGGIGTKYTNAGGANNSGLGTPLSDEAVLPSGAVYQQFENGRIYWKSKMGTWIVAWSVGDKYVSENGDAGSLGFPTSDEAVTPNGGSYQQFENGRIYWKSGLGARALTGDMLTYFDTNGGIEGSLGYPSSDVTITPQVTSQSFQGATVHKTATDYYLTLGSVGNKYMSGNIRTALGIPTGNETALPSGGTYQQFENGRIYWKSKKGAWIVAWSVGNKYLSAGADATSGLGYPMSDETPLSTGGTYQQFENGRIYWKGHIGSWIVGWGIGSKYSSIGADKSSLGYPTGDEVTDGNGGSLQPYEHGKITWKSKVGATVVYN